MLELFTNFLSPRSYIPHGHCYLWQTPLVALHLVSDGLIAIAYFSIPAMLIYFIRKRRDISFSKVFVLFGAFIVLCGTGHLLEIWTLWHPDYWVSGIEQAITALVSCYTALQLSELLPKFLGMRSPEQLEVLNQELETQIRERQHTEETLRMIVSGTASVTGEDFFPALVQNLATALEVPYALMSQTLPHPRQALQTVAVWLGDSLAENFEYELKDNPCNFVIQNKEIYCYPQDLQNIFPKSQLLKDIQAESYLGVPLFNSNQDVIGNLCILNTKAFRSDERAKAIMSVFAARAATELQRKWAEEEKRHAYEDLEERVKQRTGELMATNLTLEIEIQERIAAEATMKLMAQRERAINRIIQRMRQSLDLELIFQVTAAELRQAIECDRVLIYRFNPDWSGALVAESVAVGWEQLLPIQNDAILTQVTTEQDRCAMTQLGEANLRICDTYLQENAGGMYQQKTSYCCISDIYQAGFNPCYLELLAQLQARAYVIAPIFCRNQLWGLLASYQNGSPRNWQEAEIQIVTQIGNHLGVAVQQAELFAQTQQQAEELKREKERADAASQAKSIFLANMSHELRTPLNAILGFTQLMQLDHSLSADHRKYIEIVNQSGEHLLGLINDVLEMSKIEAGRVILHETEFNLHQLLESVEAMLQLKARSKNLQLKFERDSHLPKFIQGDENKLRQILINLLGNGIKFTQQGDVSLRVCVDKSAEFLQDDAAGAGKMNLQKVTLRFEVKDTGPGIAAEEMSHLFEAFQQTQVGRQSQEGTGLGLRISQKFVQLMGGEITVESEVGRGSCFKFQIPVQLTETIHNQISLDFKQVSKLAPGQPTYRILVAEDVRVNRLLLVKLLKDLGCEVKEAENGAEAIALWEQWHPHLIFMDMQMPIVNGYEATEQIKHSKAIPHQNHQPSSQVAHLPMIPTIIAITANAFAQQQQECLQVGCDGFVSKPFRREEILQILAEHLLVEYCYEETEKNAIARKVLSPDSKNKLDRTALMKMPDKWIEQLYVAALEGNDAKSLQLIAQIPPEESHLITTLTQLVENYQFQALIAIAHPTVPNNL